MTIDTSLTYKIRGRDTGKCIYTWGDHHGHWDCIGDDDAQNFKFESVGDGYYKIKSIKTGKCLFSNNNHGFYPCIENDDAQKFKLEKRGDDPREYKIYGKKSQQCIYSAGHGFGQYTCIEEDNPQRFNFVPAEFNCCFANVERKGAATTIDNDLKCDSKNTDPGGTTCTNIYADYCKVGDRMITDSKCKALQGSNITLFNNLMRDKCNLDEFYETTSCIDWCKNNSTDCNKLNTKTSCKEFEISTNDCTPQKVLDVKTECEKYGIRSQQGLTVYQCSPAGIKQLTDECKEYDILDSCTPTHLQDAKDNVRGDAGLELLQETKDIRAAQLELTQETAEQMQQNYETTQKTIADILNLTEEPSEITPTAKSPVQNIFDINNIQQWIKDNYNITIIIVVIIFLIISSSSVSGLLLLI